MKHVTMIQAPYTAQQLQYYSAVAALMVLHLCISCKYTHFGWEPSQGSKLQLQSSQASSGGQM
eukprot:1463583-Amphidinium_carterae.1